MSKKNDMNEILSTVGLVGVVGIGALILGLLVLSLLMCIPALLLYGLMYLILPAFGVLEVTFFQCWAFCMIAKIVGGLLFGKANNSN